jgi:serine phosphatase RsbU (regulator of sigma subunit)/anti-sigma regulatory factor (Ser/Thr protein kinase)
VSEQLESFQAGYAAALDRHLAGGGETGLELAYELGREAVTSGLSLLDLAGIHHAVLSVSLERASGPADLERIARLGGDFFLESLSTFEMTQRGFLEVQAKARLEQRHADQLRGLADAALAVNSTLSVDEMLELVAERARTLVGARRSSVTIAAENGDAPAAIRRDADHLAAPLIDREGRPLGSIRLADKREGSFSDDDESILVQLAQMASVAIANARLYERERGIAEVLQENLLPAGLPDIPGVLTAAHYRAGAEGVDVGGDWYEVIPLPGGRVGMAIGDVVGRGVRAAAMMGQLRVALRAYAMELDSPAAVAHRVARFVRTLDSEQMGTCVYAVLDPRSGELRFTIAGHPPPLALSADGDAVFLDGAPGLPFGVRSDVDYRESRMRLAPGSTLLLYTDGLVERRGEPIDQGLERLRNLAAGAPADPRSLCKRVLSALVQGAHPDDVALLAVHTLAHDRESLELDLAADADVLAGLRRGVREWLEDAGADREETADIVLAACEAAANAVEHAYGPGEASFTVSARIADGEVTIEVRDRGTWRPQRDKKRGRGLGVMRETMDDVEVDTGAEGTNVRLRRRLVHGNG